MRNAKFLPVTIPAILLIAFVMMFGIVMHAGAEFFRIISRVLNVGSSRCESLYYAVIARVDAYLIKNGGTPSC